MRNERNYFLAPALLGLVLGHGITAAADTLQLKNGTVVQGKYLGGSERALQFDVAGNLQTYPVADVISVTFTGTPLATEALGSGAASTSITAAPDNTSSNSVANSAGVNSATQSTSPRSTTPSPGLPRTSTNTLATNSTSSVSVSAGTLLLVRMIDGVDSKTNHVGDKFRASLESDLVSNGMTIAPKGADVYGRLAEAQQAGRVTGKAQLTLELTDIMIQNRTQPIVTGEYQLASDSRTASTAKRAGGGAAVGAIIGAIAGGGKGAAIGAGVGAGAGTATNAARGAEQVSVPSETLLEFRLAQPFTTQLN